jgi:uncharacterized protein (TIGR00725 family)
MAAYIGVVGASEATDDQIASAEAVGKGIAEAHAILVCGGRGGVMAAACRGAVNAGGTTVGILPGTDRSEANEWVQIAIATGLGELRNGLIVRSADALIGVGGGYGTLSEIALALRAGVPVIGVGTWEIEGIEQVASPHEAVALAIGRASERLGRAPS